VIGQLEERLVVVRVAVGPELRVLEPACGEVGAHTARLLRPATVCAVEPPRQPAIVPALQARAYRRVGPEQVRERHEVRVERRRREKHGVAELAVPAEPFSRVLAKPRRSHLVGELGAQAVDPVGWKPRERGAREGLQAVAVAAHETDGERERVAQKCSDEPRSGGASEEREDAVAGRQRAVHVEGRDDRAPGTRFWHGRTRLYTRDVSDGPEIFDDLYLGLQAGGALRKQRRGEKLTQQEREAIGRWQQMSMWRKIVAVGAFAVGTFGLGFTLGGLVFGRRARKA
jgi:hypothetical protein